MPLKDQIENYVRKLGKHRPNASEARQLVRPRKPLTLRFHDDGIVPNHPRWPLIIYRGAVLFDKEFDAATVIDSLFDANGWGRSWRDSIYDFVHYHSHVHEVLGVARGNAKVEFGGLKGRTLSIKSGDVAIIPAGTGHRLIDASSNFLVVGAYPPHGRYDECTDSRDRVEAAKRIRKVRKPKTDPVFGNSGPLLSLWKSRGH